MTSPIVSSQWLSNNLRNSNVVILDASLKKNVSGEKSKLQEIQIKGALFFDLKEKFSDKKNEFPTMFPTAEQFENECRKLGINKSSTIVVYDNIGIYTSPRVWWMFKTMGHEKVFVLNGGLPDWIQQGFDTESIKEQEELQGNFKVNFKPEKVKYFGFVKSNLETKNVLVVDARSSDRFNSLVPEPRADLRRGNIPNSINIPYADVLENGKFKSASELKIIFEPLEKEERPIVFSCGSGITACILLLANSMVNSSEMVVYDGSWTEWAQRMV